MPMTEEMKVFYVCSFVTQPIRGEIGADFPICLSRQSVIRFIKRERRLKVQVWEIAGQFQPQGRPAFNAPLAGKAAARQLPPLDGEGPPLSRQREFTLGD